MSREVVNRVESVLSGAGVVPAGCRPTTHILNYNPRMEYRRLGRTGVYVSAVCLGGHWKRIGQAALGRPFHGAGYDQEDFDNIHAADFLKNRDAVIGSSIDLGINYVDACAGPEILAYAKVLKGRRQQMFLGYSWHTRESRYSDHQSAKSLLRGLDEGMKEADLDYVDLWRISLPMDGVTDAGELRRVEYGAIEALETARRQGKTRFAGISTHKPDWLRSLIRKYPDTIQVVLFPFTAGSGILDRDSLFETIRGARVGALSIKPFADSSLFRGDSSPDGPHAAADDRLARLAIRSILNNADISGLLAGCASVHQVENAVRAVGEPRALTGEERAELDDAAKDMWANLDPHYNFLRCWERV